ncbi:MAG: DoxX family protein [Sulfitobacter sp.]|nr:DoxX family protein [Sulfitobacter sp.]
MNTLLSTYDEAAAKLERADWLIPTLARFLFAAVLLIYYLNSGLTKLGDGISGLWTPSVGAYAQIWPRALEAAGYDTSAMNVLQYFVVLAGTYAEFILPILITIGLLTRLAAIGMIGFIVVQSLTDVYGLGLASEVGAWFDRLPDAIILDQRALWVFLLIVMILKGAGPISVDRLLSRRSD